MTVHSVTPGADPDVLNVRFTDGSFLLFRVDYLQSETPLPYAGFILSEENEEAYRNAAETYSSEVSALRLVSLREHSRFLLAAKLRRREFKESDIRTVLDRLEQFGLLDDERYAEFWLESRIASKNEGRIKLLAGLLSRGVPRDIADCAIKKVVTEEIEIELVRRFVEKTKIDTLNIDENTHKLFHAAGFSRKIAHSALSCEK